MRASADPAGAARRILITGLPGSGKSTVGRLVAEGIDRSVYIDADFVRESIVGGFVQPALPFTDEFIEQICLQREIVNFWVERMVAAGFTAVIDDAPIPPPPHFASHYAHALDQPSTIRVLLMPTEVALRGRLEARRGPFDELFLRRFEEMVGTLDDHDFSDWVVIDSSDQTPSATAAAILGSM